MCIHEGGFGEMIRSLSSLLSSRRRCSARRRKYKRIKFSCAHQEAISMSGANANVDKHAALLGAGEEIDVFSCNGTD